MKFIKNSIIVIFSIIFYVIPAMLLGAWAIETITLTKYLLWLYAAMQMLVVMTILGRAFSKWFDSKLKVEEEAK